MDQLQLFQSEQQHPFCHYWRAMVRDCVLSIYRGRHDLGGHDWNWGSHGLMDYARNLLLYGHMGKTEYERLSHLEQRCRRWEALRVSAALREGIKSKKEEQETTNLERISNSLA